MRVVPVPPDAGEVFVAKQCVHCGKILPGEKTRYCPGCGKVDAPPRPLKRSISQEPPAWMKQLETSFTDNRSRMPLRELDVKVWDEAATNSDSVAMSEVDAVEDDQDVVEALPTSPLMSVPASQNNPHSGFAGIDADQRDIADELPTNPQLTGISQHTPDDQPASILELNSHNGLKQSDQIDEIATRPYVAQPRSISPEMEVPVSNQQKPVMQPLSTHMNGSKVQRPITPLLLTFPQFPPAQSAVQTTPGTVPVPPLTSPAKRSRKGLVIVPGILLVVILASVIAWIVLAQPFSVPEITTTTQHFTNATLGISLQYPRNWSTDVHMQSGTVSFYDDNHTDQVNFTVVAVDNQGLSHYITKMESSLGMTGQKTLAQLAFAVTTWQQIQGSEQLSGASYTATLLVTEHGAHYYSIVQLAPSSTYPLEEQLVFSKMRSSFQF